MINNYFILKAQVNYLKNLSTSFLIRNIFSFEKNQIIFHLITDDNKEIYLTLVIEKNLECLFIENEKSIATKNILYLFNSVLNTSIVDIRIEDKNRIVTLELSNSSSITFFAFPKYSNLFVAKGNKIVDCYTEKSSYLYTEIDALFPERKKADTIKTPNDIVTYLKDNYSYIGKLYREDIAQRIDKDSSEHFKQINEYIYSLENPSEFILNYNDETVVPTLRSLLAYETFKKESYDDINELVLICFRKNRYLTSRNEIKNSLRYSIDSKIKKCESKISNLRSAITEAGNSDKFKRYGDVLFGDIYKIEKGSGSYEYINEETGEKEIIKLNPSISISNNAANYYNKYKGMKNSVSELKNKVNTLCKELTELEKQREIIITESNFKNLKKMIKKEDKDLEVERLPFRIFKIDEKFEVWVGKDSASNDLLTMKYASQYDLWFHVRGASGSHTILKFLDKNIIPEKSLILKAASIAAYYSKARNGKHVPVAYCERKYVKKRKGFNQGAVVMEKEKVVFVNPEIPEV